MKKEQQNKIDKSVEKNMYSTINTPCYVIDKSELEQGVHSLEEALTKHWGNFIIGYSYKTNSLPWVIQYFKDQKCYAEVVSDDEYNLARSIGVLPNNIVYNGIAKSKKSFLEAVENGAIVNIDSKYEIDWLDELPENRFSYSVGIRVNFDLEKYCPGQSQCGSEGGRFGFCYENGELLKAIESIQSKNIRIAGIHLHVSSKTRSLDIYNTISKLAVEISEKYNLHLDYVDVGGGFFGGLPDKPSFDDYIKLISENLRKGFDSDNTKLIVEPGMCLIGSPVSYVTTVRDVKDTVANRFVVTDGSRTNIDPLMSKSRYFYDILLQTGKSERLKKHKQIISGFTCMEHDRLFELDECEELLPGDKIVYHKVGAYTMCLTPLFIKYFPAVYVSENGKLINVRNAWTYKEYAQS